MNTNSRGKIYGRTIAHWISTIPGDLDRDAVNLCQIISAGRIEYDLEGQELTDFVRLSLISLLDNGAVPVMSSDNWASNHKYGRTKLEIADGILEEWLASNGDETYLWSVWFARPKDW